MSQKPLLNINNPKPITPGGAFWLQGFEPQVVGNRNQLRQNFRVCFTLNSQTHANWANLPLIQSACYKKEASQDFFYAIGNKYISRHWALAPSSIDYGGIVRTIDDDGDINYCFYPGIISTEQGNMLYTSEQNLGRAFYGYHKTGTTTTTIIDKAGRDLSSLDGLVVRNIRDNSTATITSVTTTTETNDTLNFSGGWSDAGNITDGNEWVVFVDTFKDLNTIAYPHFGGQLPYYQWSRQILNFDGDYFIGHGNYIAKLSNDETTFAEDHTKLPSYAQFNCFEQVGNNILIGCEKEGRGLLLTWDGVTVNKYQSIIPLTSPVYSIKEYRGGALLYSGSSVYWTDGYSIKRLSSIPGTDGINKLLGSHSSMLIDGDLCYLNTGTGSVNITKRGIWVYDILADGWIFNPYEKSLAKRVTYNISQGGIFSVSTSGATYIFCSYSYQYNTLSQIQNAGTNNFSMAVFSYNAPKNTKINYAELVVGQTINTTSAEKPVTKITMALSDGKKPFWQYGQVYATASNYNEMPVNGSVLQFNKASIGDLIIMLDGVSSGEYAFVTGIYNQGATTEVWTLDRNFTSKVAQYDIFQVISCDKMGEQNVSDYFEQPLLFEKGLTVNGDFYVIIIFENSSGSLDLRDISLF